MNSRQVVQTTTGIAPQGNVNARDININIHPTSSTPVAKKPRLWKPFCTVQAPTPNFTGRKDLIATIHRRIQQCSLEREYSKKIVVIYGLGGMGKTELVRRYVQEYLRDPVICNAAWIDAQSKTSLEISFKSLAGKLELQTKDKEIKDVISSIYEYLADHSQPSLFIFDNAEQMRSEDNIFGIFDFLPTVQLYTIPLIIITTRVNNWEIPEENILQINELSEDAGIEFLTKRFKLSSKQKRDKAIMDALKDLTRNLQCFPLGLTLAASNIPISKLRSIPKEIKDYIKKLHAPHGDWITERHSPGTASKYDLIMNNVWAATLEKIKSQGDDGEAAISLLNIIAYLPPDHITVGYVIKAAEFSGLPTSTAGFEMLELYSLISLPSSTNDDSNFQDEHSDSKSSDTEDRDSDDETDQVIRIHRLVQRCTRDKLDRGKNYTYLLKLSMFVAHQEDDLFDRQAIHEHLKERMWPENSIQFSIIFASHDRWLKTTFEIIKDIHEILTLDEKPGYVHNLAEDYKLLHSLNLFCFSNNNDDGDINYKKLYNDLISTDPSYSRKYLEQVFVSTIGKCVKDLFSGTMDMKDLGKRAIFRMLTDIVYWERCQHKLSEKAEEISLVIADATGNSFEGSVETVRQLYRLLWDICSCCKFIFGSLYVRTVLKIHGSVYASIKETGGSRLDSYWEDDKPFTYYWAMEKLEDDLNADWNRCFQESFCTEAGLQFLRQHLQYVDALTQTTTEILPHNAKCVLDFISFVGNKWNCTKKFVQANLFMETLYSLTKNVFKFSAKGFHYQFWCLMAWFVLFGKNTCVDCNGVSWSIQSVEKEMILFLDIVDRVGQLYSIHFWNATDVLNKFIESSRSDQESIAVKTATRMLNILEFLLHSYTH